MTDTIITLLWDWHCAHSYHIYDGCHIDTSPLLIIIRLASNAKFKNISQWNGSEDILVRSVNRHPLGSIWRTPQCYGSCPSGTIQPRPWRLLYKSVILLILMTLALSLCSITYNLIVWWFVDLNKPLHKGYHWCFFFGLKKIWINCIFESNN